MTLVIVVLLGLALGYWVVSLLFRTKSRVPDTGGAREGSGCRASDAADNAFAAPADWNQVLGVSLTASPNDIRAAYRNQLSKYHPDKVDSLGPELKTLAERKTKEIMAAYQEGMRLHGRDE